MALDPLALENSVNRVLRTEHPSYRDNKAIDNTNIIIVVIITVKPLKPLEIKTPLT